MKSIGITILTALSCLNAFSSDIVTLTNQMRFEGKVIRIKNCAIHFKAQGKVFEIPASDIYSIQFEDIGDKTYNDYAKHIERNPESCLKGHADAKAFHGKKEIHFLIGFFFGPYAMLGTALSNPTPQKGISTMMNSTNKDLFNDPEYLRCYRIKAKGQMIGMEALGFGVGVVSMGALLFLAWGGAGY